MLVYCLRRGLNILLLGLFVYAVFKGMESLKYVLNWKDFDHFTAALQRLGESVFALVGGMIGTAGTLSILAFLAGGIAALAVSRTSGA